MDPTLADRIRADNRRMHDAPGYADFYDNQLALIRNSWEQGLLEEELSRIAGRLPNGFRALDLGCGTGNLTLKLNARGARVTGVDLSAGMIDRLRHKLADAPGPGLTLIVSDIDEYLRTAGETFDLVCACSFLHHLPDYLATTAASLRRVAPGGCFYVVHEPLRFDRKDRAGRWLEWVDFKWQRLEARLGVGGVAKHDPYYDPESLADYWALHRGIDDEAIERMLVDAGFTPQVTAYDSKRHRLTHALGRLLRTRHLVRVEAWRAG